MKKINSYDLYNREHPVEAALNNYPRSKAETIRERGVSRAAIGLLLGGGLYALGGVQAHIRLLTRGIASTVAGIIVQKTAKTDEAKAYAPGFEFIGAGGIIVGTVKRIGFSTFFPKLVTILGMSLAFNVLYYYLSGKRSSAVEAIKSKLDGEKAEEIIQKIDNSIKTTIRT